MQRCSKPPNSPSSHLRNDCWLRTCKHHAVRGLGYKFAYQCACGWGGGGGGAAGLTLSTPTGWFRSTRRQRQPRREWSRRPPRPWRLRQRTRFEPAWRTGRGSPGWRCMDWGGGGTEHTTNGVTQSICSQGALGARLFFGGGVWAGMSHARPQRQKTRRQKTHTEKSTHQKDGHNDAQDGNECDEDQGHLPAVVERKPDGSQG
jgi:hypothetical protein